MTGAWLEWRTLVSGLSWLNVAMFFNPPFSSGAGRGEKMIGRKHVNLIVGWCGRFLFPRQIGEWPENQILIPDWAYFYCPNATLNFFCTT